MDEKTNNLEIAAAMLRKAARDWQDAWVAYIESDESGGWDSAQVEIHAIFPTEAGPARHLVTSTGPRKYESEKHTLLD